MKRTFLSMTLVALCLGFNGCTLVPIQNVENVQIMASDKPLTSTQVRQAIIRAGTHRGWRMKPVSKGKIVGYLNVRNHSAEVDIRYDSKTYDIRYKESNNLKYDGERIHRSYNNWVLYLKNDIDQELGKL